MQVYFLSLMFFSFAAYVSSYLVSCALITLKSHNASRIRTYCHRLGKWYSRIQYLWDAPRLSLDHYKSRTPFILPTPGKDYLHIISPEQIEELSEAPEDVLSLHALSKEMLQPEYTMDGLQVADGMAANGSVHTRVLRVQLTSQLPSLESRLEQRIKTELRRQIDLAASWDGYRELALFSMMKRVFTVVNADIFFGEECSKNEEFLRNAEAYLDDLFQTAEVLRLLPRWFAPMISPFLMRQYSASRNIVAKLTPIVEQRMQRNILTDPPSINTTKKKEKEEKPVDLIQFFVDSSRKSKWSAQKIVQVLLGLWFASVHQPALSISHALDDLCERPDLQSVLRQELENYCCRSSGYGNGEGDGDKDRDRHTSCHYGHRRLTTSRLIDSFLKESCRLHPSDSISVRREAIRPYTFSDGTRIEPGMVACVPSAAIMLDPNIYEHADRFNARRFMKDEDKGGYQHEEGPLLTDASASFPLWGLGKRACPGRFYAATAMKLVIGHILLDYDIKLPLDGPVQRNFHWRSAIVPKASASILFRRRRD